MSRVTRFCFTLNNYTDDDIKNIKEFDNATYMFFGKEIAPKTGTPHLQGYCEIKQMRFTSLKKKFPRMHIEIAKGDYKQNKAYCSKGEDLFEFGKPKRPGTRNDLKTALECCEENYSMKDFLKTEPKFQSVLLFEKNLTYFEQERDWPQIVLWIYGPTGTGKTHFTSHFCKSCKFFKDSSKWWDGYDKHPLVVMDDFRPHWFYFDSLLRILDRNPYRCEFKGGYRQLLSYAIIITTPDHPRDSNFHSSEHMEQLYRRLDFVGKPDNPKLEDYIPKIRDLCRCKNEV